jgi:seryl-tRNA synthetase
MVSAEANMSVANVKRALASGRSQNYQQADGSIVVPEALRPYMGGLAAIEAA